MQQSAEYVEPDRCVSPNNLNLMFLYAFITFACWASTNLILIYNNIKFLEAVLNMSLNFPVPVIFFGNRLILNPNC